MLAAFNREFPVSRHGRFLTIWYGVLDLDATALTFVPAGHPPAVLIRREGESRLLSTNGIVTGCKEGATYENMRCPLRTGDTLFIYSDGAYELGNEPRTTVSSAISPCFSSALLTERTRSMRF